MSFFGNFCRVVVPDVRIEGGDQHQGVLQILIDGWQVGLNANHAVVVERNRCIPDQPGRLQHVLDHHRFEHIELKMSTDATHIHRHIVAQHLGTNHGERFRLGGIHLPRHDR